MGNKNISYNYDEYILAALDIYIDVITLFKELLFVLMSK